MKYLLIYLLGAFVIPTCHGNENYTNRTNNFEAYPFSFTDSDENRNEMFLRFSHKIDEYREMLKIPAVSAAIVQGNSVIWSKGFGYADIENKIKADEHTAYHIASITKTFASVIMNKLVEEGKLSLDDPVAKYGIRLGEDVKIKHLLSHTSEASPGEYFSYNSARYGELEKIMEKVSGKSFPELLESEILNPLGMQNTVPNVNSSEFRKLNKRNKNIIKNVLAKPYKLNSYGKIRKHKYPKHFGVSAGLISTVRDLAKFSIALDNHTLLKEETLEKCFTPYESKKDGTQPYGLGWFVQYYNGIKIVWHYGDWMSNSSLLVKVPEMGLTFIILANTDELSTPFFGLAVPGDVVYSIFASEFLRTFVLEDVPEIDYNSSIETIAEDLEDEDGSEHFPLLLKELIARAEILISGGNNSKGRELMDITYMLSDISEKEKYTGTYRDENCQLTIKTEKGKLIASLKDDDKNKHLDFTLYPENQTEFYTGSYYRFVFSHVINGSYRDVKVMNFGLPCILSRK